VRASPLSLLSSLQTNFSSSRGSEKLKGVEMKQDAKEAFKKTALGAKNAAYDIIAKLDPEYFDKLKGLYVDGTFGREGALPRKTKELIMVGITCALNRPRGVRLHCERALALGASPREILEAVEVAAIPGGMPGLWLGVETLQDILKVKEIDFK
jgi:alkylhydroperoxidase/carboxymuconolactone decarboxylase family protein YurZ